MTTFLILVYLAVVVPFVLGLIYLAAHSDPDSDR